MRNTKKETLEKVKEILMNNSYKDYYKKNIEGSFEETMSVNNNVLSVIGNGVVVLTEEVYQALLLVHKLTVTKNEEISFYLYGKEIDINQILFDRFNSQKIIRKVRKDSVICNGYSHLPNNLYSENILLSDLVKTIQFKEDNRRFKTRKMKMISCIVTPSKDINFLYYDDKTENFYRFGKVLVKNKNNIYSRINCYGDGQQRF